MINRPHLHRSTVRHSDCKPKVRHLDILLAVVPRKYWRPLCYTKQETLLVYKSKNKWLSLCLPDTELFTLSQCRSTRISFFSQHLFIRTELGLCLPDNCPHSLCFTTKQRFVMSSRTTADDVQRPPKAVIVKGRFVASNWWFEFVVISIFGGYIKSGLK